MGIEFPTCKNEEVLEDLFRNNVNIFNITDLYT